MWCVTAKKKMEMYVYTLYRLESEGWEFYLTRTFLLGLNKILYVIHFVFINHF